MYESFYNLARLPFENTPDPRFFYASEQHREALAAIEYTIRTRKGIVLITGEIGAGKTTVARTMLRRCSQQVSIVQLLHGHDSGKELLSQLLRAAQIDVQPGTDRSQLLEQVNAVLTQSMNRGRPLVLFIDEAQTLADEALEELRLLSNFDTDTRKLLQLVLVGQPELRDRLGQPRFQALRQRVALAKHLQPLSRNEIAGYIAHRLEAAMHEGATPNVQFNEAAIQTIHRATQGVPRLINVVCDNCMLLGFVRSCLEINRDMVLQVVQDMVPGFEAAPWSQTTYENQLAPAGDA